MKKDGDKMFRKKGSLNEAIWGWGMVAPTHYWINRAQYYSYFPNHEDEFS
ncbi:ABC-type sugar transport system, permease component [Streptococcus suis ST1]|nr:ABC-type sugar transport system, permease component [Streptococcus suis ST1]